MQRARVHIQISGRVQGVAFRANTQDEAVHLGLTGWVRNLPDGDVELEAEGPRPSLESLLAWCHHGPPAARVSSVRVSWVEPTGEEGAFRIRYA